MAAMEVGVGEGGLQKVILRGGGESRAEVYAFGAHVTSWRSSDGVERIYTSPTALYNGAKAIRGGIPVCFPQFGPRGPLKQHGFARTSVWTLDTAFGDPAKPTARFVLRDSPDSRASAWSHHFEVRLTVRLADDGDSLSVDVAVENRQLSPFAFTCALHSYFACASQEVTLFEFDGGRYLDNIDGGKEKVQDGVVVFGKEVDRIYVATKDMIKLANSNITISKSNLPEAVVWNPHVDKAAALADMPDDDYKNFICIEPAVIMDPVELLPGAIWDASLVIEVDKNGS